MRERERERSGTSCVGVIFPLLHIRESGDNWTPKKYYRKLSSLISVLDFIKFKMNFKISFKIFKFLAFLQKKISSLSSSLQLIDFTLENL